ncbi:hypothetical protein BIW11_12744 [Tropilaelaps mercedesae]|uniref:C2H2-type domain-containing protein n=1 Tax=Tropilaelaps mercedesae TaxID=418985 RepID=A0A1V9X5B3_9ACAR|nr:hypothetical protein BIW11_12744 [Tropilaelaps mercedesae]
MSAESSSEMSASSAAGFRPMEISAQDGSSHVAEIGYAASVDKVARSSGLEQTLEYRGQNFNFQFASGEGQTGGMVQDVAGIVHEAGLFEQGRQFEGQIFQGHSGVKDSEFSFATEQPVPEFTSTQPLEFIERASLGDKRSLAKTSETGQQQTSNVIIYLPSNVQICGPTSASPADGEPFGQQEFCSDSGQVVNFIGNMADMKSATIPGAAVGKTHLAKTLSAPVAGVSADPPATCIGNFLRENTTPEAQESVKDEVKFLPAPPEMPTLTSLAPLNPALKQRLGKDANSRNEKKLTSALLTLFFDERSSSYQRELVDVLKPLVKMLELLEASPIDAEAMRRMLGSLVALVASLQGIIVADRRRSVMTHYGIDELHSMEQEGVELFGADFLMRHGFAPRKETGKASKRDSKKQPPLVRTREPPNGIILPSKRKRKDKRGKKDTTESDNDADGCSDEIAQIIILDDSTDRQQPFPQSVLHKDTGRQDQLQTQKGQRDLLPANENCSALRSKRPKTEGREQDQQLPQGVSKEQQVRKTRLPRTRQSDLGQLPAITKSSNDDAAQCSEHQSVIDEVRVSADSGVDTTMDFACLDEHPNKSAGQQGLMLVDVTASSSPTMASKVRQDADGLIRTMKAAETDAGAAATAVTRPTRPRANSKQTEIPSGKCSFCELSFAKRLHLAQHLKQTHADQLPQCEICNRRFAFETILRQHLEEKHSQDVTGQRDECKHCGKTFSDKDRLQAHLFVHTGTKQFECSICSRRCLTKAHLDQHMAAHGRGEERFYCERCDKPFAKKTNYNHHLRLHSGEKNFECDLCHKRFATRQYLHIHLRSHSAEKPFTCDICGRGFQFQHVLVDHVRTHTGETPFVCEVCGISFKVKRTLKRHMKTHGDERPHTCHICQRGFKVKATLREHMKTHSNEKPYQCHECGLAYKRNVELRKHACPARQHLHQTPAMITTTVPPAVAARLPTAIQLAVSSQATSLSGTLTSAATAQTPVVATLNSSSGASALGVPVGGGLLVANGCDGDPVQVQLDEVTEGSVNECQPDPAAHQSLQTVIPVRTAQSGPDGTTTTIILQPMGAVGATTAAGANFTGIHFINL